MLSIVEKQELTKQLVASLRAENDIRKVVIFGSFLSSDHPNDMDVAVFQESAESYLKLAMKYRKLTRAVSKKIQLDIFPVRLDASNTAILSEIEHGEVVYEK
ncbi:MAG: nucleotidyltransferase domain-containing protein [Pseudomonadota bacterium]